MLTQFSELKELLEAKVKEVNNPDFIESDPIQIPKSYKLKQDIEISAFWVSMLAWGQRKTIINKTRQLFSLMDNAPFEFIVNHQEKDRKRFSEFKHRTFQYTDTLYFLEFLQWYYSKYESLEDAFAGHQDMKSTLSMFHNQFFHLENAPTRTRKHVSTPARNSSCKRLNMFLRWMVRSDGHGVDFGLWKKIPTSMLMIPLDVHVERVARQLGLLERKQRDWKAVEELTANLRKFDPADPVKYDFALYGMGVLGEL
ncbi:MAG: TIGR02757 family protein [Saprospiraceae bacterium]|nr:TIGR02757 family protein [Bacteroidia bacterium]NNF20616.1 TIGR02757 family protein [Saprospiraceae bacterium]